MCGETYSRLATPPFASPPATSSDTRPLGRGQALPADRLVQRAVAAA
jgi:hypothetical protein